MVRAGPLSRFASSGPGWQAKRNVLSGSKPEGSGGAEIVEVFGRETYAAQPSGCRQGRDCLSVGNRTSLARGARAWAFDGTCGVWQYGKVNPVAANVPRRATAARLTSVSLVLCPCSGPRSSSGSANPIGRSLSCGSATWYRPFPLDLRRNKSWPVSYSARAWRRAGTSAARFRAESADYFTGVFNQHQGGASSPLGWLEWASFGFVAGGWLNPVLHRLVAPPTPVGNSPVSEEPPPAS